ncbi:hypothetical protein J437_LFUL011389 [Ladona fulva]|uniref:Large ribosomal subunit protein uL10m n=1 Tax=Ladona fulva TaxID=123851 RepID=A0A8K0P162_LADFU|nr:hypothetical protein J437_LFUL011389 [Ladona fulva]
MASPLRKAILVPWIPEVQIVRFRNKINIGRPAQPHYRRAKVLKICTPTFYEPLKITRPMPDLCMKPVEIVKKKEREDNPYGDIIAKELYKRTSQAKFVGFLHCNPVSAYEEFKVKVALKKHDASLKVYGRDIAERAYLGTFYEPALCLLHSHSALIFGDDPNPKTIANLLQTVRRTPSYLLLAAIIDNRMLDRKELETYSKLSDLTTVRSQLVATLTSACGGQLAHLLNSHQSTLVQHLDQHINQQGSSANAEEDTKSSS